MAESTSDGRIDSGNFNMSKTAKKWLVKNGFDATKAALVQFEQEVPALKGKLAMDASVDPYNHILNVQNPVLLNGGNLVLEPKCKQGDNPYIGGPFTVSRTGLGVARVMVLGIDFPRQGYIGKGGTWIKMANNPANRSSEAESFLTFVTNLRTRVFLAVDGSPPFARATEGWELQSEPLVITANPENPLLFTLLKVFGKLFEKGKITIPGPRCGGMIDNNFAYAILVCPI